MNTHQLGLAILLFSLAGCASTGSNSAPPQDASESFAAAVNSQDIEATMAHWSEDALVYFLSAEEEGAVVSRDELHANYEHMFQEDHAQVLEIHVDGSDRVGGYAHEWGWFEIADSRGCYVILRRASDGWRIYREWIVEPCGH